MKCFDENYLEKIVMGEEGIRENEKEHLFACDRCRERFLFFTQLHQEFSVFEEIVLDKQVHRLVRNVRLQSHIILKPIRSASSQKKYPYKLAAKSSESVDKFIVNSFSNMQQGIVGRVLYDRKTAEVSLFLIAENMELVKGQKVKLIDSDLEGITDCQGTVSFGQNSDFQCSAVQIQSPSAIFDLTPHTVDVFDHEDCHSFTLKNEYHDEMFVQIDRGNLSTQYQITLKKLKSKGSTPELQVVALTNKKRTIIRKAQKGVSIFETQKPEKILKIHIF